MATKQKAYIQPNQTTMYLYENQAAYTVNKDDYKEKNIRFLQVGYDEWTEASRNLKKKCSLQLYLYLSSNMDGSQWALSPSDICSKTGMARSSYHEAKKELIDKGYMYEHKKDGKTLLYDCYDFYTSPKLNPHIQ